MSANIDRVRLEAIEKRRGEAEELVKSRKRKLAELYTVSSLSRIRQTTDEQSLRHVKDSLLSFLERNDIQRGQAFDTTTLPPLEYDIDEVSQPSTSQQTVPPTSSTTVPQSSSVLPSSQQVVINAAPQDTEDSSVLSKTTAEEQATTQSAPALEKPSIATQLKIIPSSANSETAVIPTSQQDISPDISSPTLLKVQPHPPSSQPSSPASSQPKSPLPTTTEEVLPENSSQSQHLGQTRPQPSSVQQRIRQQVPRAVSLPAPQPKKKRRVEDRLQLYDFDNKDAVETLVLILRGQLPAKIAECTPLSELYYLAQTLPLVKLMPATHKVVTSTMYETALTEGKINVIHSRIDELKRQGKWSLKQPSRFVDPFGSQKTHWDNMLSEMNWMAADFKEGRKMRIAVCAMIAESVEEFWRCGRVCCVKTRPIKHIEAPITVQPVTSDTTAETTPSAEEHLSAPPRTELVEEAGALDTIDVTMLLERSDPMADYTPVVLPKMSTEEFSKLKEEQGSSPFKLFLDTNDISAHEKTLLDSVPAFSSFQDLGSPDDCPLIPVSKPLMGPGDNTWYNIYMKQVEDETPLVPSHQKGLFGFSSQKRASTAIKPPHPPSLKYLNLRTPTIWLPEDDQDLIEYVNLFSFNWGVVSAHLSKRPTRSYQSNIERRTPWQCFERYIQLNDSFQIQDMRGLNASTAMKWLEHAHHIQATTKRRISPLGVGPDSIQRGHKRLRWASMFEAIRKCMRKRESVTRPNPNQVRKNVDEKKVVAPTPAELLKLKYEREKGAHEAFLQTSAGQARSRGTPIPAVPGVARPVAANTAPRTGPQPTPSAGAVGVQQRFDQGKRPSSVPAPGIPKAGAPAVLQTPIPQLKAPNGTPYTPEQIQQIMAMKQKKVVQQQQQAAAIANAKGSPSPNGGPAQVAAQMRSNSNPIPGVQSVNNPIPLSQGHLNGVNKTVPSSSVAAGNTGVRKTPLSQSHINAVIQQIQASNPGMSKNEVTKIAAQYLTNITKQQQNRSAPASANGGASPAVHSGVNSPRASQSPVLQSKSAVMSSPAPMAVPTPQQILQQQAAMSSTSSVVSPQGRVVSAQPVMVQGGAVANMPVQHMQAANLTPQQLEQLKKAQAARQQSAGGSNVSNNGAQ